MFILLIVLRAALSASLVVSGIWLVFETGFGATVAFLGAISGLIISFTGNWKPMVVDKNAPRCLLMYLANQDRPRSCDQIARDLMYTAPKTDYWIRELGRRGYLIGITEFHLSDRGWAKIEGRMRSSNSVPQS